MYDKSNQSIISLHAYFPAMFYYSTSGGSGSGIASLLMELIQNIMPEKVVISFPVLPDISEDATSQLNCLAAFEEFSRLDILSFPIDNQQVKNINPFISKNKMYDITNTNAIYLLHLLASYIEKSSKNGNFDEKDLLTILSTKGVGHICEIPFNTITDEIHSPAELAKLIHEEWDKSIFAPIEISYVTRAAVIYDGDEIYTDYISHESIFSKFMSGIPVGIYEGYYQDSTGKIITVLSGLPWFTSRLKQIEQMIENNTRKLEAVIIQQATTSYTSSVSELTNKLRLPTKKYTKAINSRYHCKI